MSVMFLFGIFAVILIFGSFIVAGVAIWALAAKKESMPKWGKIVLWLFIALAAILLIVGILVIIGFLRKFGI